MAKSSDQARVAAQLVEHLIHAFGLPLMQDIADQVPRRGRGHPGRLRNDEFRQVCLLYITRTGIKFTSAAKQVYADRRGGLGMSEAGFADTMTKKKNTELRRNPLFLENEALRVFEQQLGPVRGDLFPIVAQKQKSSLKMHEKSIDLSLAGSRRLSGDLENYHSGLTVWTALYKEQFEQQIRQSAFFEAFKELLNDDLSEHHVAKVYSLVWQLMKSWAQRNI